MNISTAHLEKCELWPGSTEETQHKFCGGLNLDDLIGKRAKLSRWGNLTAAERDYLKAINKTLEEAGWVPRDWDRFPD